MPSGERPYQVRVDGEEVCELNAWFEEARRQVRRHGTRQANALVEDTPRTTAGQHQCELVRVTGQLVTRPASFGRKMGLVIQDALGIEKAKALLYQDARNRSRSALVPAARARRGSRGSRADGLRRRANASRRRSAGA